MTIAQTVNAFFRWEFNSCEMLVQGDEVLPIDYANACPDVAVTSLHYYFPWAMRSLVKWSAFCVATGRRAQPHVEPDAVVRGRRRRESVATTTSWLATSSSPTTTSSASATRTSAPRACPTSTRWSSTGSRRRASTRCSPKPWSPTYPEHEVDQFLGPLPGSAGLWMSDQPATRGDRQRTTDMTMTYRQLGVSGLTVSTVGIGCNNFGKRIDAERTQEVVDAAFDQGVTFFDTADIYSFGESEELLGRALGSRRGEVVIATKFGMDMHGANGPDWGVRGSRRYIRLAVEASLRRLGTDWIDLYQLHTPDPHTPIEETLAALQELVTEGKVRYIGSSNLSGWQIIDADWTARTNGGAAFVTAQNRYSLYDRSADDEVIPACEHVGVEPAAVLPAGVRPARRASTGADAARRTAVGSPDPTRLTGSQAADFDRVEAIAAYADCASLTHDRRRNRRPGSDAGCRLGDRRCDECRTSTGQCRGARLGAVGC